MDLNINQVDALILTHTHFDHVGNAARLKKKYNVRVFVHRNEALHLMNGKNIIPEGTTLLTRFLSNNVPIKITERLNYEPCQYDIIVDSFYDLENFGFKAYILHTPGHSNGSMCVIIDDEVAVVGDALYGVFKRSAFPTFAEDVETMIDSWGKLLATGCKLYLPAHGTVVKRELLQKDYNKRKRE